MYYARQVKLNLKQLSSGQAGLMLGPYGGLCSMLLGSYMQFLYKGDHEVSLHAALVRMSLSPVRHRHTVLGGRQVAHLWHTPVAHFMGELVTCEHIHHNKSGIAHRGTAK